MATITIHPNGIDSEIKTDVYVSALRAEFPEHAVEIEDGYGMKSFTVSDCSGYEEENALNNEVSAVLDRVYSDPANH